MPYDTFLSWAGTNTRHVASWFKDTLRIRFDRDAFYSVEDIRKSQQWHDAILSALRDCTAAMVFLDHHSASSDWVLAESGAAIARSPAIRVFPVLVGLPHGKQPRPLEAYQATNFSPVCGVAISDLDKDTESKARAELTRLYVCLNGLGPRSPSYNDKDIDTLVAEDWPRLRVLLADATQPDRDHTAPAPSPKLAEGSLDALILARFLLTNDSPSYFVDTNWLIQRHNVAASLLLGPITDNMPFADHLQAQRPHLREAQAVLTRFYQRFVEANPPAPSDTEVLTIDHPDYGEVRLRKTAVVIKHRKRSTGWVFAYNIEHIVHAEKYYAALNNCIRGALFAEQQASPPQAPRSNLENAQARIKSIETSTVVSYSKETYTFELSKSSDCKRLLKDLSFRVMARPDYGLCDRNVAEAEYGDTDKFLYFGAYLRAANGDRRAVGCLRLEPFIDINRYSNLDDEVLAFKTYQRDVAEAGVYIDIDPMTDGRGRSLVFEGLVSTLLVVVTTLCIDGIYTQCRDLDDRIRFFKRRGFAVVGKHFEVPGWDGRWLPLLCRILVMRRLFASKTFGKEWRAKSGLDLDTKFWRSADDTASENERDHDT